MVRRAVSLRHLSLLCLERLHRYDELKVFGFWRIVYVHYRTFRYLAVFSKLNPELSCAEKAKLIEN